MARRVGVIAAIVVGGATGLFAVAEAYFYLAVLRPGVAKMIDTGNRGDLEVQTELGMLYEHGGIPRRVSQRSQYLVHIMRDPSKSAFWYQKAAAKNHGEAEMFLSLSSGTPS